MPRLALAARRAAGRPLGGLPVLLPRRCNHGLTNLSADGKTPQMVDVSQKAVTLRTAVARSEVELPPHVASALLGADWQEELEAHGKLDPHSKKGPVFTTAIIAGVQGVKRTSELIPFCHPLPLHHCGVNVAIQVTRQQHPSKSLL